MVQIENSLTPEEFLAVLNAAPPSPAEYARFVKAYYQAIHPHASRQKLAELSESLQEWLERETSQGRAAFLSNYLAWAPAPEIPAAALRRVPQAARTISRALRDQIAGGLVSARLRTLVDEWLATGQDAEGSESPARRHVAFQGWEAASEYLEQSPPAMSVDLNSGGLRLSVGGPDWKAGGSHDFFKSQKDWADRLFVGFLASDWQARLCKCRYGPCGRYFVAVKLRGSYRRGVYCSRQHRARASAEIITNAHRKQSTLKIIDIATRYLLAWHSDSAWRDDRILKARLAAKVCVDINRDRNLRTGHGPVSMKWVTRNREAIEGRRQELARVKRAARTP